LDLENIFFVSHPSVYDAFHTVIDWTLEACQFPLKRILEEHNWEELKKMADQFSEKTDGVSWGAIAVLDVLSIIIKCPSQRDGVPDPGNYYCRKICYALNVQAMADHFKRIILASPSHKGYTHDSTAFGETLLFGFIKELAPILEQLGRFCLSYFVIFAWTLFGC
jgi:hypothetical protein